MRLRTQRKGWVLILLVGAALIPLMPSTMRLAASSPAFVQISASTPQSPQLAVATSFTKNEVAGDTNIIAVGWNDTTTQISSVTDSAGNTYKIAAVTAHGSDTSQAIYYASNVKSGADTVTVTFSQAAAFPDIRVAEYSGVGSLDGSGGSASGNATTARSGSVTTTASGDLLFAAGMSDNEFTGAGSGYTKRVITSPDADIVEDAILASPATTSATAPQVGNWLMQLVAFTPQTPSSTPTPTPTATTAPAPISISAVPCIVTLNGVQQTGTCSGTFTPNTAPTPTPAPTSTATATATPKPSATPTPSPSPTTSPSGACPVSTRNTPGGPDPWGGCFPGNGNSGYPSGTHLTSVSPGETPAQAIAAGAPSDNTGWSVDPDGELRLATGAVVDAIKDLSGVYVPVATGSATVKNSYLGTINDEHGTGTLLVLDDTIDSGGDGSYSPVMQSGNGAIDVEGINGYNGEHGVICAHDCTIKNSWLHGNVDNNPALHENAIYAYGGPNMDFEHNSLWCSATQGECTADMGSFNTYTNESQTAETTNKNLFVAGDQAFCIYPGPDEPTVTNSPSNDNQGWPVSGITISNNVFQRGSGGQCSPNGPVYGWYPSTCSPNPCTWTANTWDDGTALNEP